MAVASDKCERAELDDFVVAYEQAFALDPTAQLREFLPSCDHPLYEEVLRELVRVDLEYGFERGAPRSVADYEREFPELKRDPEAINEIVFEEFRLRWLAVFGQCAAAPESLGTICGVTGEVARAGHLSCP